MPTATQVIKTPLRYPGGKSKVAHEIVSRLPKGRYYREPFVGGGGVFLSLAQNSSFKYFWINDIYEPLIQFWLATQSPRRSKRLIKELRHVHETLTTVEQRREMFAWAKTSLTLDEYVDQTDIAECFFFVNRCSFSGSTEAGGFSKSAAFDRFNKAAIDRVEALAQSGYLDAVNITNVDYEHVVNAPGSDVVMFIDAPYMSAEKLYGRNGQIHQNFDHARLAHTLRHTKHSFLMTYDDTSEIRKLYKFAKIEKWTVQYGMSAKQGKELFISNY